MSVDLNADLGEGFGPWRMGDDAALLDVVTSANVACGFHAGDPSVLLATCREAVARGVAIGAHVGYRDLAGFGRSFVDVEPERLFADVVYQLAAAAGTARVAGGCVSYVKPHGALYNAIVRHEGQAQAVVDAVAAFDPTLALLALPGSEVLRRAERAGLRGVGEFFADRAYAPTGELVSRREPDAVLHDVDEVVARVLEFAATGEVVAVDGSRVPVVAESICLHGDNADAVALARAVRAALAGAGVELRTFA